MNKFVATTLAAILVSLVSLIATQRPVQAGYPDTTTTTLAVSSSSVAAGTVVTLTATVTSSYSVTVAEGQVTFCDATATYCDGTALFGVAQMTSNGTATLRFVPGVGSYSIQAVYGGAWSNGYPLPSTSSAQTVTVTGNASYATSTAIAASGSAGNYTLTGTVTAFGELVPTGNVNFLDTSYSNATVATAPLNSNTLGWTYVQPLGSPITSEGQDSFVATGDFNNDGIPDIAIVNSTEDGVVGICLGNGDGTFQSAVNYSVGPYPLSIAVADVNNDGDLDLIVPNLLGNNVSVLLGNGNGIFQMQQTYATGDDPQFVAVADFNHDGWLDLAVSNNGDATVGVLLNNGDGTFASQVTSSVGNDPYGVVAQDFNGDGIPDLAVTNVQDGTISILIGYGDGTFNPQSVINLTNTNFPHPEWLATADLRKNGNFDLVVPDSDNYSLYMLLGNGDGSFATPTTITTENYLQGVSIADWNADGILDLIVPIQGGGQNNTNTISVFPGNGDGTFGTNTDYTVGTNPNWAAVADFNGDGLLDMVSVNTANPNSSTILLQQRTESATATGVAVYPAGTHLVDANYAGDTSHASSLSTTVILTGTAARSTSTALAISPNTAAPNASITFTATISPTPTGATLGTVNFYSGSTLLGTGSVNSSGVATLTGSIATAGSYTITAVYSGNPEFAASTSSGVSITIGSNSTYSVSAPSTPVTVAPGGTAVFHIEVPPVGGSFDNQVTMSASGLPAGAVASFSPPVVVPGTAGAPTTLTVKTAGQSASLQTPPENHRQPRFPFSSLTLAAGMFLVAGNRKRLAKSLPMLVALAMLAAGTLALTGCNGGFQGANPTQYVIAVTGTSGAQHASTTVTLIVQ
jgi:hypothetical protein